MEYKIFRYVRHHVKIPFFIRFILACLFMIFSLIPIILPIFPGSIFLWIFLLIIWLLFIVPAHKIKHVVKIKKWIIFLSKNFHRKKIISHKIKDIKFHIKEILNEDKWKDSKLDIDNK